MYKPGGPLAFPLTTSLREAIAAIASGGTIYFAAALDQQAITLANSELVIDKPLEIEGSGLVVNGNDASRVFHTTHTSGVVKISGLTIMGGHAGAGDGGGVLNDGGAGLWLVDCALVSNDAANGGAISNQLQLSTLTVERCLIWGNSATAAFGGGIDNYTLSTVLVSNSTITGNTTGYRGSGISNTRFGVMKVVNCTIVNNAGVGAGTGGGLYNTEADSFAVGNTILVSNTSNDSSASDVAGDQPFTSLGGNYVATSPAGLGFTDGSNGDQVGTVASPLPNVVGVLADNGGKTATHNLLFPSTAADAGRQDLLTAENFPSGSNVDQRGALYPRHGVVDIGAMEADPRVFVVDTLADEDDGTLVGGVSLRDAVTEAPADSTINFSQDLLAGGTPAEIQLMNNTRITISRPMTINGLGARALSVHAGLHDRIFSVTHAVGTTKISGLTITGGDSSSGGGAISVSGGGNLRLLDCTVSDSYTHSGNGGGISITGSSATIERCTISGNGFGGSSQAGGGIHCSGGSVLISNSTISGNRSTAAGGGVHSVDGDLKMVNCTVVGNTIGSGTNGAGIASSSSGTFSLGNTLIERNNGGTDFSEVYLPTSLVSLGGNYVSRSSDPALVDGVNGDQVGTIASPLPAITEAALANNGGPTDTHALLFPSRGVGRGNEDLRTEEYFPSGYLDQAKLPRLGHIDVGALEARPNRVTVTTTNDEQDGVSFGEGISFREALDCIGQDGTVVFPAGSALLVVPVTLGELPIDRGLYITRDDGGPVSIEGDRSTRIFRVATSEYLPAPAQVSMSNLTIRGGRATDSGGGILVVNGSLFMDRCTITDNEAQYGGGLSLFSISTAASISYSTISGNMGNQGVFPWSGGIDLYDGATLDINNSTVSGNSGGMYGGISMNGSSARITSCTIVKNQGAAVNGAGGISAANSSALTIADSIIQMNTTGNDPMFGDIELEGTTALTNDGGNYMGIVPPGYPFGSEADDDYAGTAASPLPAAVEDELTYRGGATNVHFPLNPGPAINKGKETLTQPSAIDQRGSQRQFGYRHDIGAVEWSPFLMDGRPDELTCPATNGFQISENDGWVYASVEKAEGHTYYVLFSERPRDSAIVDNSALTSARWDVYMKFANSGDAEFHDEDNALLANPDPDRYSFANGSDPGGDRFEVAVLKQFVGGHRSFVSIVEMDGSSVVAQYPAGNGSPLTRDEFLPVITGISTCTDLSALRELVVEQLLGIPLAPRHQRGSFPLEYLDTNDDLLLDATDASYLER
jgi:hypothetical protein